MLTREFDYIVRPGDTLFGIALKFNVPICRTRTESSRGRSFKYPSAKNFTKLSAW